VNDTKQIQAISSVDEDIGGNISLVSGKKTKETKSSNASESIDGKKVILDHPKSFRDRWLSDQFHALLKTNFTKTKSNLSAALSF